MEKGLQIPPIAIRDQRIQTAVGLGEPDKVPFVPSVGTMYSMEYGITMKDAMTDIRSVIPGMVQFCKDCNPDLLGAPAYFPIPTMETLQAKYMGWPGKTPAFGENAPYQMHDGCFLEFEEYETFIKDPTAFLLQKVLPARYLGLAGLSMVSIFGLCGTSVLGFGSLGIPPVQEALKTLIDAGQKTIAYLGGMQEVCMTAINNGYPIFGNAVAMNPFDEFADCVRGLLNTIMDLAEEPELVAMAVERFADVSIPASIGMAKLQQAKYVFVPLHAGMDSFMSPENYEKYYWPPLCRLINALVAADLTPLIVCEGSYFTRLDVLKNVQKGKVVYFFEKQDMKKAKQVLGDVACIAGNIDTHTLMYGSKEKIIDETRRLLDVCAPGGGYMMSNSLAIDACPRKNMMIWAEATDQYGRY